MKALFTLAAGSFCWCCVDAQSPLDYYTSSTNTFTEIGAEKDGLSAPHDLDFVPNRPDEWWVLNKEARGGSMVLFFDAGLPTQSVQLRRDSHNEHFMARSVAFAFGDNNYFASAQEIKNTSSASSTFMGPALWSSDTSIFARIHQNNWETGKPLGSHIDMLHQSPFGMGITFDTGNTYWYFDGYAGNICKYAFATPHGIGEDDHSDGRIYRYTDVMVSRLPDVPSHMALDKVNNRLFMVDGGNKRIIMMNTATGSVAGNLTTPASGREPLAEYKEIKGAEQAVIVSSGLSAPCGIDYVKDRIVVSDYTTGNIYLYNVSVTPASLVGTIITGGPGVMGVRIDSRNRIWYVNKTTRKLYRIDNPKVLSVPNVSASAIDFAIYPNPASNNVHIQVSKNAHIRLFDLTGRLMAEQKSLNGVAAFDVTSWSKGIYQVVLSAEDGATAIRRFQVN